LAACVEAAAPPPLIDVEQDAIAPRNRTDVDVIVIDVPAIIALEMSDAGGGLDLAYAHDLADPLRCEAATAWAAVAGEGQSGVCQPSRRRP